MEFIANARQTNYSRVKVSLKITSDNSNSAPILQSDTDPQNTSQLSPDSANQSSSTNTFSCLSCASQFVSSISAASTHVTNVPGLEDNLDAGQSSEIETIVENQNDPWDWDWDNGNLGQVVSNAAGIFLDPPEIHTWLLTDVLNGRELLCNIDAHKLEFTNITNGDDRTVLLTILESLRAVSPRYKKWKILKDQAAAAEALVQMPPPKKPKRKGFSAAAFASASFLVQNRECQDPEDQILGGY